jgi:exodeoxyribonuclease-3
MYVPNGNPQRGPMFEYKLAWFERLNDCVQVLIDSGHPFVIAAITTSF